MALSAEVLADLMDANMPPLEDERARSERKKSLLAMSKAIVQHFTTAAVVGGTATGAMGGGPGVPVVGTIT